jgi:hypothetical protein
MGAWSTFPMGVCVWMMNSRTQGVIQAQASRGITTLRPMYFLMMGINLVTERVFFTSLVLLIYIRMRVSIHRSAPKTHSPKPYREAIITESGHAQFAWSSCASYPISRTSSRPLERLWHLLAKPSHSINCYRIGHCTTALATTSLSEIRYLGKENTWVGSIKWD